MPSLYPKNRTQVTAAELAACKRVADYLRRVALPYLADIYADKDAQTETKRSARHTPFVEFYLTFWPAPVARFDRKMTAAIKHFASGRISAIELKAITDEYIEAHTVVWLDGVPHWKVEKLK